jgi:lipoic acid synthetase
MEATERLPVWFKQRVGGSSEMDRVLSVLDELKLNTVCESACCPNRSYCYSQGTATFMILGDTCTRGCRFCAVSKGKPQPVDDEEHERIGLAVKKLGLKYVVITSVTRDDLVDGGAEQFAKVVREVRKLTPAVTVELLVPDFQGRIELLETIMEVHPDVIGHNLETVPRLYLCVRPEAVYERSIKLLMHAKSGTHSILTKSGLMLGLGETKSEVEEVMHGLRSVGCDILTLGQYLQPSEGHFPVVEYISPEQFREYRMIASDCGFKAVASNPLVRSSYNAEKIFRKARGNCSTPAFLSPIPLTPPLIKGAGKPLIKSGVRE